MLKVGASRKQRRGWNIWVDMACRLLAILASLGPRGPLRDSGASDLARGGSGAGDRVPSSSAMSSRSERDSWLFISESVSASKAVPPPSRLLSEPLSEPSLARAELWLESDSKPSLRSLSSAAPGRRRRRRRRDRRDDLRLLRATLAAGAAGGGSGPGPSSFSRGSLDSGSSVERTVRWGLETSWGPGAGRRPRCHLPGHARVPPGPHARTCAVALQCGDRVLALLQLGLQPDVDVVDEVGEEGQGEGDGRAVLLGPCDREGPASGARGPGHSHPPVPDPSKGATTSQSCSDVKTSLGHCTVIL